SFERILADRIEHGGDTLAAGQLPDAIRDIFAPIIDDFVTAVGTGQLGLFFGRDGADDAQADKLGPLPRTPRSLAPCPAIRPTPPAAACSRMVSPAFIQGLVFKSQ